MPGQEIQLVGATQSIKLVDNFDSFDWRRFSVNMERPTFIRKLCYKLPSVVTFIFIQTFDQNFVFFTERRHVVDRHCDA